MIMQHKKEIGELQEIIYEEFETYRESGDLKNECLRCGRKNFHVILDHCAIKKGPICFFISIPKVYCFDCHKIKKDFSEKYISKE
jgi:hypothetical protein